MEGGGVLLTQSTRRCGGGFALKYVIAQRTGEKEKKKLFGRT